MASDSLNLRRPTALVVLGMHRSGTSALAALLHLLGADVPPDLMPANEFNQNGYWESTETADFNDELLKSAEMTWDTIARFPSGWLEKPQAADFRRRAVELLRKNFGSSSLFVLKDPRISILVPFWTSVLNEMNVRPVFALTTRHPGEVADSLAHRNHFPRAKSMLLWLIHLLEAERSTRGRPRCFLTYDMLLTNWRLYTQRVGKTLELPWPNSVEGAGPQIDAILSKTLQHHRASTDDLAKDPAVVDWVKRAYATMLAAADDNVAGLSQTLDEIAAALNPALLAFGPLLNPIPEAKVPDVQPAKMEPPCREKKEDRAQAERAAIAKLKSSKPRSRLVEIDQLFAISGAARGADGSWQGDGEFPRFLAAVDLAPGYWRVRANLRCSAWSRAVLWLDTGRGFIDCESIDLAPLAPGETIINRIILVPLRVSMIRFDPVQAAGEFSLTSFSIKPTGGPDAPVPRLKLAIRDAWRRFRRPGAGRVL